MELIIKYHDKYIDKVKQINGGDWLDLRAAKTTYIKKGEFALIPLGISIKLRRGYEAHIVPRSSTFKNYGVIQTNGIGIIDNSYCGDDDILMMPVYATRDTVISKNDRICQMRVVKNMPALDIIEKESLSATSRGGFGSTGVQ